MGTRKIYHGLEKNIFRPHFPTTNILYPMVAYKPQTSGFIYKMVKAHGLRHTFLPCTKSYDNCNN